MILWKIRHNRRIRQSFSAAFCVLALLAFLAYRGGEGSAPLASTNAAESKVASSTAARDLVNASAGNVHAFSGLDAEFSFRSHGFGHSIAGTGKYLQLRPAGSRSERLFSLELKTQLESGPAVFHTICGRQFLWTRRDLGPEDQSLTRVNLRTLRRAIIESKTPIAQDPNATWIGITSLSNILGVIGGWFEFEEPVSAEYSEAKLPAKRIRGKLMPDMRENILGAKRGAGEGGEQIPDAVELYLADDSQIPLFPYRMEFQRSRTIDGADFRSPMLTVELIRIRSRNDIDPSEFNYEPGDQDVTDVTEKFLGKLGLALPME